MTRVSCFIAVAVLVSGTLLMTNTADARGPKTHVSATPTVGFAPLVVHMVVKVDVDALPRIEQEEWYCLRRVWKWGDGQSSSFQDDCPPWEPVARREFTGRSVLCREDHKPEGCEKFKVGQWVDFYHVVPASVVANEYGGTVCLDAKLDADGSPAEQYVTLELYRGERRLLSESKTFRVGEQAGRPGCR